MTILALSLALSAALMPASLPASVLFRDAPATMEQMKSVEGEWAASNDWPALTLTPVRPGWMSFRAGKGLRDWAGRTTRVPVAVTTHDGQLFISMAVRFAFLARWVRKRYRGKECYGTMAVVKVDRGIDLLDLNDDAMRAVNRWYPEADREGLPVPCGKLVRRAKAAVNQRVIVILEPRSWYGGPFHRVPIDGLDKQHGPN